MARSMTENSFWILTSLAGGRRHGYEILQETATTTALKATTLYAALERLEREGLVRTDGEEVVAGRTRRYYALTDEGSTALGAEADELEKRVRIAREHLAARPTLRPVRGIA